MSEARQKALADLDATCEDLADLQEAFERGKRAGRLQGLEEAKREICEGCRDGWPVEDVPQYALTPHNWHIRPNGVPAFICAAAAIRGKIAEKS